MLIRKLLKNKKLKKLKMIIFKRIFKKIFKKTFKIKFKKNLQRQKMIKKLKN